MSKYFILNAENFGISKWHNKAVIDGYNNGFLTSASICANGEAFSAAVNDILPECPNLGLGIQLNISYGKSVCKSKLLTDDKNNFNKKHTYFLANYKNEELLKEIEDEFRAQIDIIKQYKSPDHITSCSYIHSIPAIFEMVTKLAKEYNIPYVTTYNEPIHILPSVQKHINSVFYLNLLNLALLKSYSIHNLKYIKGQNIQTNDYFLGLIYRNLLDTRAIKHGGLNKINDGIVECCINPSNFDSTIYNDQRLNEYKISLDMRLKDTIERMGFEITNYSNI